MPKAKKAPKLEQRELKMAKVVLNGQDYIYWFYFDKLTNEKIFNKIKKQERVLHA